MTRRVWACINCGWEWLPRRQEPSEYVRCDVCGGHLEEVDSRLVRLAEELDGDA